MMSFEPREHKDVNSKGYREIEYLPTGEMIWECPDLRWRKEMFNEYLVDITAEEYEIMRQIV